MVKKLKKLINNILNFMRTDEFKTMVVFLSLGIAFLAVVWGATMTVLTEDLTNVAIQLKEDNATLEEQAEYYNREKERYKMMYEETYELFTSCVEASNWYEDFYYDNVDPYTGEVQGEYYE